MTMRKMLLILPPLLVLSAIYGLSRWRGYYEA